MSEGFDRPFTAAELHSEDFWMLLRETAAGIALSPFEGRNTEQSMNLEWGLRRGRGPELHSAPYEEVGSFRFQSPDWQRVRYDGRVFLFLDTTQVPEKAGSSVSWRKDPLGPERQGPLIRNLREAMGQTGWAEAWSSREFPKGWTLPSPLAVPITHDVVQLPMRTPTLPPATHTNCYVVGDSELTLVDPGSPYPEEQEKLDRYVTQALQSGKTLRRVFLTHHHHDHVGGASWVRERWCVPIVAHPLTAERLQGRLGTVEVAQDGDVFSGGKDSSFQALWTPGHAPGHLVLLEREQRWLIAGDMVAGESTIVIDPREGNMADYLRELARLRDIAPGWVCPSHGSPIWGSRALFTRFIEHRLARETQFLECLSSLPQREGELVDTIYVDLNPLAKPLAVLQARAHLLKLMEEGRAIEQAEGWVLQA